MQKVVSELSRNNFAYSIKGLCVTGPRSTVNDYVVYDETFATKCAVDYFCVLQKYELESDDTIGEKEQAGC